MAYTGKSGLPIWRWPEFLLLLTMLIQSINLNSYAAHYQQRNGFQTGSQPILGLGQQQQTAYGQELNQLQQQQPSNQADGVQQQSASGPSSSQVDRNSPLLQLEGQLDQRPANGGLSSRNSERDGPIFRYHGAALNSSSVKLVWSLLNGNHADFFDIEWGPIPDGTHQFSVSKLNGTARDYTFHQLQPDTLYQFELHAYHGNTAYKPQLVVVRTPQANYALTKNPQDHNIMPLAVKAEPKSNSSIQLSWSEAEKPTSIRNSIRVNIIRFYVNPTNSNGNVAPPSSNETASAALTPSSSPGVTVAPPQYHYINLTNSRESRVLISKLQPATEYAFAVKTAYHSPDMKRVFTQSGFSMDTLAKTLDIEPSAPRNFTISPIPVANSTNESDLRMTSERGRIELSWLPPESPNGQLKSYAVFWMAEHALNQQDLNDSGQQWTRFDLGPTLTSHHVGNLMPGTTYYFKMRALNQRGLGAETDTRHYSMPALPQPGRLPVPQSNILLVTVICFIAVVFCLFLLVSRLACKPRRKSRKSSLKTNHAADQKGSDQNSAKLNGFASTNSGVSSTVAARVGTLARRRDNASNGKPDFWISALDNGHQQAASDIKSNISEKSNSDLNMAMVSLQRESPQFATTQLAPNLPDYRFASIGGHHHPQHEQQHLLQQLQQQTGHYRPGHFTGTALGYDQMDSATASALMTLSKRQQQQMQKYQIQFASTGGKGSPAVGSAQGNQMGGPQAPSPHQQPPPPPPLNIEQQHQHQTLYGTHQGMQANTRSLRLHRSVYDPVSGSFLPGAEAGPPNYNSHHQQAPGHHMLMNNPLNGAPQYNPLSGPGSNLAAVSNTLQFHPHQSSTLLSRRSTNTLRSFQTANSMQTGPTIYGQLTGVATGTTGHNSFGTNFAVPVVPPSSISSATQPQQILQSHQAVINQLNNSTYPSLPLKHVSAVRPQIMSSLEDHIEMELAEKEHQEQQINGNQQQQQQQQQHQDQLQTIKQ